MEGLREWHSLYSDLFSCLRLPTSGRSFQNDLGPGLSKRVIGSVYSGVGQIDS